MATRSSSLPKIIARIKIYFSILSKLLKLPDGPIISPIPGPTLARAVVAPDKAVMKSNPKTPKTIVTAAKHTKKLTIMIMADLKIGSSTTCFP